MIFVHLCSNGKSLLVDKSGILLVEECETKNDDGKTVVFTRIFLKQPIPGEDSQWIDVNESVDKIAKMIR